MDASTEIQIAPGSISEGMNWSVTSSSYRFLDAARKLPIVFGLEKVKAVYEVDGKGFQVVLLNPILKEWIFVKTLPPQLKDRLSPFSKTWLGYAIEHFLEVYKSIVVFYLALASCFFLVIVKIAESQAKEHWEQMQVAVLSVLLAGIIAVVVPPVVFLFRRNRVQSYMERWFLAHEAIMWTIMGLALVPVKVRLLTTVYPMTKQEYYAVKPSPPCDVPKKVVPKNVEAEFPDDVYSIMDRKSCCEHWSGESPFDDARKKEIEGKLEHCRCSQFDDDLEKIKGKYKAKKEILKAIEEAGSEG